MRTRVLGSSGIEVSEFGAGDDDVRGVGQPRPRRSAGGWSTSRSTPASRCSTPPTSTTSACRRTCSARRCRPPRPGRAGDQVRQRDGRRPAPPRRLAPVGARGGHRQPAPARHRPHRPVPDAPSRPRRPFEETLGELDELVREGSSVPSARRRFPSEQLVEAQWIAERGWLRAARPPSSRRTRSCAAASSAPCSRCAGATTSAPSCGRRSTAVG